MKGHISVPVKIVNRERWGDLAKFGLVHEICAEVVDMKDSSYSFAGGHRVRLYKFRKNVHWKIPVGIDLDISNVPTPALPQKAVNARHKK